MHRFCLLSAILLGLFTNDVSAQIPNCGSIATGKDMYQAPGYQRYVFAYFETSSQLVGCAVLLQTEGWIVGVGSALVATNAGKAWVRVGRTVPTYGIWHGQGKHWVINAGLYMDWGESHVQVDAVPPPGGGGQGGGGSGCEDPEYEDGGGRAGDGCDSPIVVDVAGDGYKLTSVRRGVMFDLNADGIAEAVAWTRADGDDAFLALDRNNNGIIDNGSELFGNATPAYATQAAPTTANGFEALKFAQGPSYGSSTLDGRVDANDAVFSRLLLWTDRNHNGISEPAELQRVADSQLAAISTSYRESRRRDRHGNEFRLRAKTWWADGSERPVFDVWLRTRDVAGSTDDDDSE